MKFRNLLALVLVIILGVLMIYAFIPGGNEGQKSINTFGKADLSGRTAGHYIKKDVNGNSNEIVYGETTDPESGSANMVTSVIVNYRSFDTLGEVTVLFLAATGLGAILSFEKRKTKINQDDGSTILVTGVKILFPLLLMLGAYIFIHGHLTPGGGFQGGAVIATAFLLLFLARRDYTLNKTKLTIVEGLSGIAFVGLGLYGLSARGAFLANFLHNGTVGSLFSAGIIPVIYVIIGFKVGAELSGIINNLVDA